MSVKWKAKNLYPIFEFWKNDTRVQNIPASGEKCKSHGVHRYFDSDKDAEDGTSAEKEQRLILNDNRTVIIIPLPARPSKSKRRTTNT